MKTSDIILVGGGVVGLTVARRLAADGSRVTLLERNGCGGESSWAGAGILSPCNPHRDDALAQLQERSFVGRVTDPTFPDRHPHAEIGCGAIIIAAMSGR